jgi:hypothetical protein
MLRRQMATAHEGASEPAKLDERNALHDALCLRVAYEGLTLGGRRANLEGASAVVPPERRSRLRGLPTLADEDGAVMALRVQSASERVGERALQLDLSAAHGAAHARATRRARLGRADGVIIVVDSLAYRIE